jgi:hypothetical protein
VGIRDPQKIPSNLRIDIVKMILGQLTVGLVAADVFTTIPLGYLSSQPALTFVVASVHRYKPTFWLECRCSLYKQAVGFVVRQVMQHGHRENQVERPLPLGTQLACGLTVELTVRSITVPCSYDIWFVDV